MENIDTFIARPGEFSSLEDFGTSAREELPGKKAIKKKLKKNNKKLTKLQDKLYAYNRNSLLIIFQAMDAAGKDSTIKHVMSGLNPQGCQVYSFKQPSVNELEHDFLWRTTVKLPERGNIGIFNRSYYEEVLVARVHPGIILNQRLPGIKKQEDITEDFWKYRYESINDFEKHITLNGTQVIKFFLHVSKDEQKKRFLERIENSEKNWKYTTGDIEERKFWNDYQQSYQEMIRHTSLKHAPWYIIPADDKRYMRLLVSKILVTKLEEMHLEYPAMGKEQQKYIKEGRKMLENE